ncbi:NAD(P)/FAD-dependent oxidoreductase [Flavobacterium sp. MFBS3-15]|uniref:NAD(P)/FAD-dependent oxidoreductase n=1 Tax=Flavobacterium sp. MFBS3-15 TaxID=2989816 RepID=UPI002236B07D|nr:NAD(P)/FAD-dependent oxidoreductase [Flavobacterium sp. MFBS3-15]MCW4468096.1 NAD(P)/FAD-dependent oxidoreductase [Flavobacterium sp. MFBS3-15]
MFDVLIIGGGASGVSCALVIGSALKKPYAEGKRAGILTHQKASMLQDAIFWNAYGVPPGKLGSDLMSESLEQLTSQYPEMEQIPNEKVMRIDGIAGNFTVVTNKNTYQAKAVVVAIGSANTFAIESLMDYVIPHKKAIPEKNRIQLKNDDHLVAEGIYVAGTLAGHRSQLAIAAGSGASVATDIMTLWNNGIPTQYHDSTRSK